MPYVTSVERLGREEEKILEKQKVLHKQLSRKFEITEQESKLISNQEDPELLDKSLDEILFAETKEEVPKHLQ